MQTIVNLLNQAEAVPFSNLQIQRLRHFPAFCTQVFTVTGLTCMP